MSRIYIDRYTGHLERTDVYRVRLTLKDGTVIEDLEPRKLFPFSNNTMYISLLDSDEKEVGFVRDFDELDDASKAALEGCFSEYYMIPQITRIIEINEKFGSLRWTVDTDRGEISFRIRNRNSDIKRFYGTNRIIVRDSNDNRYEIPDFEKLDKHSRSVLFSFL